MGTIISSSRKFIFIHIPKTAGRSVEAVLGPYRDNKFVNHKLFRSARDIIKSYSSISIEKTLFNGMIPEHATLEDIYASKGAEIVNSYYKFCIVRSPWDRALSEYLYQKLSAKSRYLRMSYWKNRNETFDQWLDRAEHEVKTGKHNTQKSMISIDGKVSMDCIIPLESIDNKLPSVLKSLNIEPYSLKRLNVGVGSKGEYFSKATIKKVYKIYEEDFEFFSSVGINYKKPGY